MTPFSRRQFLKSAGAATPLILGQLFFHGGTATAVPFVRRDIGGIGANDPVMVSYRKAIIAMQALPTSNPLSWAYQAAIHGTTMQGAMTAWNTCEHGTYFFWSWHRMYLYWFERIIRKMSDDYGWSLPYWNWSSPSERQLPPMFCDATSVLYTPHRNIAINNGTGSIPAFDVDYSEGFSIVDFTMGSASIESRPHNDVHVDIGGWMGSVPTAAQDPIFYLHHANMDRLWDLWLAQGGGRGDPLNDATWKNTKFIFFDETGNQLRQTGCDILRAAQQLDYTYENEPPQVSEYCIRFIPIWIFTLVVIYQYPGPPVELGPEQVNISINVASLAQQLITIAESKTQTLFLQLDEVEAASQPGAVWEVYLGVPAGQHLLRDPKSPFYVGNVALFGAGVRSESQHGFKSASLAFPINRAILAALKANQKSVPVTFIPHGVLVDGKLTQAKVLSPVRIGKVNIAVQTKKAAPKSAKRT